MYSKTSQLTFNLVLAGIRSILFQNEIKNINRRPFTISYSDQGQPFAFSNKTECYRMAKTALLLLADGAEELESITIVDVLRRGQVNVTIAGVCGIDPVKCRSDTLIVPDKSFTEALVNAPYNAIILPGGLTGAKVLSDMPEIGRLLKAQQNRDGIIGAICAAPLALKAHNIGKGKCITSYPAMADELKKDNIYKYKDDVPVVVDGNLITSKGPATAFIFSFTILELLQGQKQAKEVAAAMLYQY